MRTAKAKINHFLFNSAIILAISISVLKVGTICLVFQAWAHDINENPIYGDALMGNALMIFSLTLIILYFLDEYLCSVVVQRSSNWTVTELSNYFTFISVVLFGFVLSFKTDLADFAFQYYPNKSAYKMVWGLILAATASSFAAFRIVLLSQLRVLEAINKNKQAEQKDIQEN